jgi:hypothetical protein
MVEIPTSDDLNLITGNHYFPPDTIPEVTSNYFRFLKRNLDTQNACLITVWEFNTPGLNRILGLSVPNFHYYSNLGALNNAVG